MTRKIMIYAHILLQISLKVSIFMPIIGIVARRHGDQLARQLSYLQRPVNRQPGFRPRTRRAEAKNLMIVQNVIFDLFDVFLSFLMSF